MMMNRFYITGSLVLGKGDRTFADTSSWLQLGKDTTNKGMVLPRVVLDSIKTSKRGLFVYDLKDSVLYHFDSNKRVRYMTYKDTLLIKQLIATHAPSTDTNIIATKYFVDNNGFVKNGGNTFGMPITIGANDNQAVNIETNNTNRVVIANDGRTSFSRQVTITDSVNESKLTLQGAISKKLYAGVSSATFDATPKGFVSYGNSLNSNNATIAFDTTRVMIPNGNVLVGKYADNLTDKLQVQGTVSSYGVSFNNPLPINPMIYNVIRRFNDESKEGLEIVSGGGSGGFGGGFRIKTRGAFATTNPIESFVIHGDIITMGYHTQNIAGHGVSSLNSQVNLIRNNVDGHILNLWNRDAASPLIQSFSNISYGSGGPAMTAAIVSEADNYTYRGILSFFTNNGTWGNFESNVRAMFIDGYQNVGIGLSRGLAPAKEALTIVLPSARLHVLGSNVNNPVSIFQSANAQTADITQWKNNSGTTLAKIDKDGNADVQKLKTAQPSSNGAGEYKLGKVITGAAVTVQTDKFIEVEIDGVIYKLAIVQ
ncbi:hypothetical protein CAP35_12885 [Chitinophagaceae bacterium IBVUCB1]|nr:hypothetical protein CAP35_12885 [Chitinophagaceae bacterium IBVUCB1]